MIVLEGVEQVSGSFRASLEDFVRNGGHLLIFPSARPDINAYGQFLGGFGIQGVNILTQPILPQSQLSIAEPNRQNPFYADVFERTTMQGVVNTPLMQPVWNWSGVGEKILTFKNLQNFITATKPHKDVFISVPRL